MEAERMISRMKEILVELRAGSPERRSRGMDLLMLLEVELDCKIYEGRCLMCGAWGGDREAQFRAVAENPTCMDLKKGWPMDGSCNQWPLSLNLEITGDATAELTFDANFGCIRWEMKD